MKSIGMSMWTPLADTDNVRMNFIDKSRGAIKEDRFKSVDMRPTNLNQTMSMF
jgi:hypothetical protein